ncbi:MAG: oligosaccharide flippase family protein [Bacteroidota bacterium]
MGVIKRQGIKQSIVNYIGVGIGAISTLFIYPLDTETYGLARFLIDTATFLVPFLLLGFSAVSIRFFPDFKAEGEGHHGFLSFLLLGAAAGCGLFLLLTLGFRPQIEQLYADQPPLFQEYLYYLVPIAILLAFVQLFYNYCTNFKRIVVPSIFQNFIKLALPTLILLHVWEYIARVQVAWGIVLNFAVVVMGLLVYIYYLKELKLRPDWGFLTAERIRQIRQYAAFGLFSSIGSVLAFRIDSYMVSTMLDFENNGVYGIAAFIGNAIAIPTNAINQIASPIIAQSFKEKDHQHIGFLYRQSSINLLLVGLFLFVGIALNVHDLFDLMPSRDESLKAGIYVVIVLGLARIIDMATSVNNPIINYSPYYRFGFYAILFLAGFNIICNLIFIPRFAILGAALATLASLSLYNALKLGFIWYRFGIQPFSRATLQLLAIAGFTFLVAYLLPLDFHPLINIAIRSTVLSLIYIPTVLYFNISPEASDLWRQLLKNLGF